MIAYSEQSRGNLSFVQYPSSLNYYIITCLSFFTNIVSNSKK